MKRIFKNFIYLFVISILFLSRVDAATLKIGSDSAPANAPSREVTIEISGDDLANYTKVEFGLSISGTSYADINSVASKNGVIDSFNQSGNTYSFAKSSGLSAATIGTISYKTYPELSQNFQITPVEAKFCRSDGACDNATVESGNITYQAPKSSAATLTALSVSQGALTPEFNPSVLEYDVVVSDKINSLKLSATASAGATKMGTGTKTLVMGKNTFQIVVTAEDGTTTQTYTVNVNRGEINEPSAYLKSLTVNNIGVVLSPEFDQKLNKYSVDVTSDITELDFKYETEDKDATVDIEGNKDFVIGENKVVIKVTSSNETDTQEYEITVNVSEEEVVEENKEEKTEKKKLSIWVIILIILIIIGLIGGTAFLLFKKKSKGNKPKKDKKNKDEDDENDEAEESVTGLLKAELYDNDETSTYNSDEFKEVFELNNEDLERTKEFNVQDFK